MWFICREGVRPQFAPPPCGFILSQGFYFVKQVSKQAKKTLREAFGQELLPGENPLLARVYREKGSLWAWVLMGMARNLLYSKQLRRQETAAGMGNCV